MSLPLLRDLADRAGVATEYWGWDGQRKDVSEQTLVAVLGELGLAADSADAIASSLADLDLAGWRSAIDPFLTVREGAERTVEVHVPAGAPAAVTVQLEDTAGRPPTPLAQVDNWRPDREVDGTATGEASFLVPADLPPGYHRLRLGDGGPGRESTLLVYPRRLRLEDKIGDGQAWGYAVQLYSVRSRFDWGIGDLSTLATLATDSAAQGADFILVNPLHAGGPHLPLQPSPYSPAQRAFLDPIYLRPEAIEEYRSLAPDAQARIERDRADLNAALPFDADLDRDRVWPVKIAALRAIWQAGRTDTRQRAYDAFRAGAGRDLDRFAVWSLIVARHGVDQDGWPAELRDVDSPPVRALDADPEADFYRWLQWVAAEQLDAARASAASAGMRVGVINDLAVGVGRDSAEVWGDPATFATDMSVGAPPDHYNALGQDWGQTPWRPTALAVADYLPYRRLVRRLLSACDGLRIDHVMGLSRLWWIPGGSTPLEGTYVRYQEEAMLGILLLEASRSGGVLVGEDLGTVEPGFRDLLAEHGLLGTSVVWFEREDDGSPRRPEHYRRACMSSVTTHDLAPTAGYLRGAHITLRDRLNLLPHGADGEWAELRHDLDRWRALLTDRGLLPPDGDDEELLLGLHRFLCATPSQLLAVALPDAVGDLQVQNQPGTSGEYRNWKVPLTDTDGRAVPLEGLFDHPHMRRLATVMREGTTRGSLLQ